VIERTHFCKVALHLHLLLFPRPPQPERSLVLFALSTTSTSSGPTHALAVTYSIEELSQADRQTSDTIGPLGAITFFHFSLLETKGVRNSLVLFPPVSSCSPWNTNLQSHNPKKRGQGRTTELQNGCDGIIIPVSLCGSVID
jgi:hypothetical protein